jgi:hypothetical protein
MKIIAGVLQFVANGFIYDLNKKQEASCFHAFVD